MGCNNGARGHDNSSKIITDRYFPSMDVFLRFLAVSFSQNVITPAILPIVERNMFPDAILRIGMRRELEMELMKTKVLSAEARAAKKQAFIKELKSMPIAIQTKKANEQHYEVPDEFYRMVLGPCLKYSSCYYATPETTLAEAEIAMLEMYCERAGLVDGMKIIDLGCGWGSVTLYMAKKYPNSQIRSISNSNSQREFIMKTAAERGLNNVFVFTGDITTFDLPREEFYGWADRVISIEMFEHMKNYQLLMKKVSNWIKSGGKVSDDIPFISSLRILNLTDSLFLV